MPDKFDCDVAVIGAGPAGSTFARLAAKKLDIVMIDKSHMAGQRPKPCGGLLSPDAQRFLARSGLTLPREILVTPQIFAVKTIDLSMSLIRYYQRSYLNMNRERFDEWLRSLVPKNVRHIDARCKSISRVSGGFKIILRIREAEGCCEKELTARYVVGADGASSIVRRTFFKDVKIRSYTALQRWFTQDDTQPFYSCVFDKKTSDCCSWSISKDEYMIYGGAFEPKNCREHFERQLESAGKHSFVFGKPVYNEACMVLRPKSASQIVGARKKTPGVMLIGEAGGFISPSSLEGISWAMASAECAAHAFDTAKPESAYARACVKLKAKLVLKMFKSTFMYNPLLRRLVMISGVQSLKM